MPHQLHLLMPYVPSWQVQESQSVACSGHAPEHSSGALSAAVSVSFVRTSFGFQYAALIAPCNPGLHPLLLLLVRQLGEGHRPQLAQGVAVANEDLVRLLVALLAHFRYRHAQLPAVRVLVFFASAALCIRHWVDMQPSLNTRYWRHSGQ